MRARRRTRVERARRWYPAAWWDRYGQELSDLLDDTYGSRRLPPRALWSLVREGTGERLRVVGLAGRGAPRTTRVRIGALEVLVAFAMFVVAGSLFAKFSEHWDAVTPAVARATPATAMTLARVAAFVAGASCVLAAVVSLRPVGALLRRDGATVVTRRLAPAMVAGVVALSSTAVVVGVAHHLTSAQRNGGSAAYGWMQLAWVVVLLACLAQGIVTVARMVLRVEYRERELRGLVVLAASATAAMAVVLWSMLLWWIQIAQHAPWFFSSGAVGTPASPLVPALMVCGTVMVLGLALAITGCAWALRAAREPVVAR